MKPPIRQRKPNRMPNYDYSTRGCYFVTICIKNCETKSLGNIIEEKSELSPGGEIAKKCWLAIPDHFPLVRLDEFVIMPDHIHGIVVIQQAVGNANLRSLQSLSINRSKMLLSTVIQNFKAAVTREVNKSGSYQSVVWQKSFYDHIIHSHAELVRIREYVKENPKEWPKDEMEFDSLTKKRQ